MNNTNLVYGVKDRPGLLKTILFAFQQVLAILAATIVVPVIVNSSTGSEMSQSAALFGAGVGTIVYLLFTKFKSPVFLGSSFAFIGSMCTAFGGAISMSAGYLGLIIGAVMAGLVYVLIAVIVKFSGVKWIDKVMPAAVVGPTVAIIGLSLSTNAISDLFKGSYTVEQIVGSLVDKPTGNEISSIYIETTGQWCVESISYVPTASTWICLLCGLVTLATVIVCSVYGKKMMKIIPFIIGIVAGYAVAAIFTVIGTIADNPALMVINFSLFKNMSWLPDFTFVEAFKGFSEIDGAFIGTLAVAYVPVAFVVFAEHLADHKNISSIIGTDLTKDPGLHRTLLGDGIGSMAGAFFGGCPNTTYGESIGCVAISGNASVITIFATAIVCILSAFIAPLMTALASIPSCVMGGVCISLYGFIAVSGLKMVQNVDLSDNKNLFVVSVILIAGIGGMVLEIGKVTITSIACALILGVLANVLCSLKSKKQKQVSEKVVEEQAAATKDE